MKTRMTKLTGQALASAYAALFSHLGETWATYEGGGWIVVRGEGLRPHPKMAEMYPNGWSLLHRVRSGKARAEINAATTPATKEVRA